MKNVAQHEQVSNRHVPVDFTDVNFRPSNIPRELRALPNWVCWKLDSEQRKLPVNASTGKLAKSDDPSTWANYSRAISLLQQGAHAGIGFIFNGAGYVGVDLDDCRDAATGFIEAWAQAIIEELDSYSEISPSGTGVHIIVAGNKSLPQCRYGKVEIYETERYFTVTGDVLDGRKAIRTRSLANLETRLTSTKSAASIDSVQRDHSASGETWKLVCSVCERSKSRSAAALEDEFRRRYPQFAKERDQEKNERAGKSYIRYEIERWLEKKGAPMNKGKKGERKNCTDVGNSERLAALYGQDMHYCAEQKVWYCWDGRRWEKNDPTGRIMSFAKKVARSILGEAEKEADDAVRARLSKWAISSETRTRLESMIALCRDLDPIRLEKFSVFDRDLHLLNFQNGTLDLRTGILREHRRADLITKILMYDYQPNALCPRFMEFVEEAIGKENVPYLQKCMGYSLTGDTREKRLFLCCGPKDRGKTTLLELMAHLLGDLCASLDIESLLCSERFTNSTNVHADLADLAGARFAISSEPERRAKLSSTRIKNLTKGQGSLKAIRKYENWIEFPETYKIWLDMNSLPSVEDDDATWVRLVPIPFQPPKRLDRELRSKLHAEAGGILAWLVQGAKLWYAEGLQLPQKWEVTRSNWRKHENKFQQFIHECCIRDANAKTSSRALLKAQHEWAEKNNALPLTDRTLSESLSAMKFTKIRLADGSRRWKGIAISY